MNIAELITPTFIESIKIQKRADRIEYIRRIFEYESFLGMLVKQVKRNPYYYNDTFDKLYDMNFYHLEELEQNIHQVVTQYKQNINGE